MNISLTTKQSGSEISWTLGSCSSAQVYQSYEKYTKQCCLSVGKHPLKCKDSHGDGWNRGFIEIQGNKYCDDFRSGSVVTKQVTISGIYAFNFDIWPKG